MQLFKKLLPLKIFYPLFLMVAYLGLVSTLAAAVDQVPDMAPLSPKTFGDANFTVTASSNSGLPVATWQSSDPSVARISATGEVTIFGAGQTSIIAFFNANTTFNAAWIARPLLVSLSNAPLPSGTITTTYDGSEMALTHADLPSGDSTEIQYRNLASIPPAPTPEVIFQNSPSVLERSYFSVGLQANLYGALAKQIRLAGTARKVTSCDVTLVNWAKFSDYPTWIENNPDLVVPPKPNISVPGDSGGFYHPITLSFYAFTATNGVESYRLITSKTVKAFIPWRPVTLVDGVTAYDFNGFAFKVPFTFDDGVILPSTVFVAVSYNTSAVGIQPLGVNGPYDALNIAHLHDVRLQIPTNERIGTTTTTATQTVSFQKWRWGISAGASGPIFKLTAIPTTETRTPPINAGTYEVKTQASHFESLSRSTSQIQIDKAPLSVNFLNLTQVGDGSPKSISVATVPTNISTRLTYAGSLNAPRSKGLYEVFAESADPNYIGQARATLTVGDTFSTWQTSVFASAGLPPEQTTDVADPDGDGISNFLEYATNLNPLAGESHVVSSIDTAANEVSFIYRKNLLATELDYSVISSSGLNNLAAWEAMTPIQETAISNNGIDCIIKTTFLKPTDSNSLFMSLKVSR